MNTPHLVYFADPMCSWCWGFSRVITAIDDRFGSALPIRLVMGGLRPGTKTPMDAHAREGTLSHWRHVHEASGQPFNFKFFDREHFVYDTEPACRAVVIMRRAGMKTGLAALRRVHEAFYAENRDVTDTDMLAALAAKLGFDEDAFRAEFAAEAAKAETLSDFEISSSAGVRGFPTVIAGTGQGDDYVLVTSGYQSAEHMVPVLERWFEKSAAT